jgi:outer membrane protein assembly factor BamB
MESALLAVVLTCSVACSVAPQPAPAPVTGAWTMYRGDLARDGRASGDSVMTDAQARRLAPAWRVHLGGAVDGTPVVWQGEVIAGSADGVVAALDAATGRTLWTRRGLGPVAASPAVAGDGVVVATLDGSVRMLRLGDGHDAWRWQAPPHVAIWASPFAYANTVIVGLASPYGDTPLVPGGLVALSAATGAVVWSTCIRAGCAAGDGVWSTPAIDSDGVAFVGVGNPDDAVLAFNPLTGERYWMASLYPDSNRDVDVGASPVVLAVGDGRRAVAQATVAGLFAMLEAETGVVIFSEQVVDGSAVHGLIASPAYDGTNLYVASASPPTGVFALYKEGGGTRWRVGTTLPVYSAPALGDGVLVFGTGNVFGNLGAGYLIALATDDGRELWSYDVHSAVRGGPALAGDLLVAGDYAGDVLAFRVSPY